MADGDSAKGHLPIKTVLARSEKAWAGKRRWLQLLREVYEFGLPNRNPYYSGDGTRPQDTKGQKKTERLFDSTLANAVHKLANRLQADLTPPFSRWAKLVPGPVLAEPSVKEKAQRELFPINEQLFTIIGVSNFDVAVAEFYLDLVAAGLGILQLVDNRDGPGAPVNFVAVPQAEVAIEEGPWGAIWGHYRRHSVPRHLIKSYWPDAKEQERPGGASDEWDTEDVQITEAHYWSQEKKRWLYEVICQGNKKDAQAERLVSREYKAARFIAARWSKIAGEVQGRSLAMIALPDAKTLNLVKELVLRNAAIAVSGLWLVKHTNVVAPGKIPIRPGVQIPVQSTGGTTGASVVPLERPGGFDVASLVTEELRMSINEIMLNKSLPPDAGPVRSATEIIERLKELQQDLGAPFGRLLSEFLRPFLSSVLGLLHDIGVIRIADEAIKVDGAFIDIQVQSPMAQNQDLVDVENTVNWLTILQQLGQEIMFLSADIENMGADLGLKLNVPPKYIRPQEQRSQLQKQAGAMMGMQQAGGIPGQGQGGVPVAANAGAPARIAA